MMMMMKNSHSCTTIKVMFTLVRLIYTCTKLKMNLLHLPLSLNHSLFDIRFLSFIHSVLQEQWEAA